MPPILSFDGTKDAALWRAGAALLVRCQREWKRWAADARVQRVDYELLCNEPLRELMPVLRHAGLDVKLAAAMLAQEPPHNANEATLAQLTDEEQPLLEKYRERVAL